MTATDIREWARDHGYEISDKGPIRAEIRSAFATAQAGEIESLVPASAGSSLSEDEPGPPAEELRAQPDGPGSAVPPPPPPPEPPRVAEKPPKPVRPTLADRAKTALKTTGRPRRVSLENIGGVLWGLGAKVIESLGEQYIPMQRMAAFQAPVAGMVIEDTLKGTVADRALQPVARLFDGGSKAGALTMPLILTGITCARPSMYPVTRPMLMWWMKEWVVAAGPQIREMKKREQKFIEEMQTFGEEFGITIDDMLDKTFEGMFPTQADIAKMMHDASRNGQSPAA